MSIQLVASFAHATSSIVKHPTRTPVLEIAKGMGRIELQHKTVKTAAAETLGRSATHYITCG